MSSDGKRTEKKVTKKLKALMVNEDWWFHRLPDAAVCRGRIPKQPGDYFVMYQGDCGLVEVKECEDEQSIKKSRLTQLPKMRRFEMAGGAAFFIISHPYGNHKFKWRLLDLLTAFTATGSSIKLTPFKVYLTEEDLFYAISVYLRKARHTEGHTFEE